MKITKYIFIIILILLFTPLFVSAKSEYLYDVLKNEAESGGLAREYTGEHQDSMAGVGDKKIYHWYAANSTQGTQILDKNNVIFGNHCWQMLRTTDTGGVKMIYNGEAENNQCLSTRGTHVGYASRTNQNLASNYWYGTDYTYDKTNNVFSISGTTEQATWSEANASGLIGKYTCKQATETGTCTTLYLVESYYNTSNAYVIPLNSNSNYSQFGMLQFNANNSSPADVGYMYNTRYTHNSKTMTSTETMLSSISLGTTYWYANSVTWGTPTANRYNLDSPYQVSATTDYPNLVGEYTFRNTTQTYTSTSVYYIAAVNNTTMYYIELGNETGTTHDLSYYNHTYTYGDSYTDNGNGTYTINNATTINRSDWYTSYSSVGAGKYVCKNAVNDTCSELWYTTATTHTKMTYIKVVNIKYANGFTWDGSKYILDNDTSISFWDITDSTNKTSINNTHYTCWNETGECTTISYIYYLKGITPYYINITNGKSVGDAVNEMLYNNDVNTINSTIKSGVDAWYKKYILPYDNYVEDTIFCNNRSQSNADTNAWNPNGGSLSTYMYFEEDNGSSDLSCSNETDKFSISNNKARLTYKVGLMSLSEMNILNNSNARKTEQSYWLGSPNTYYYYITYSRYVHTTGSINFGSVSSNYGVRPSVSLKSSARAISGDGSTSNPYQLSFDPVYSVNVEVKNETKDLDINIEDMTSVLLGEEVIFKVTPITGYKVNSIEIVDSDNQDVVFMETGNDNEYSFVMPESDVTIIPSYERVSSSVEVEDNTHTKELIIEVEDISAVVYEDIVLFTVVPEKGYEVDSIDIKDQDNNKIDYQKTDKENEYSFVMPASDVTIIPNYKKVKNSVNASEDDLTKELIIEVNDSEAVVYEDIVRFTVVPEEGYEIEDIEITDKDGNKIEYKKLDNNEYEFIMPDMDVVIKPIYKKIAETSNNNIIPFLNPKTKRNIFFMLIIIFLFGTVIYKKKRVV